MERTLLSAAFDFDFFGSHYLTGEEGVAEIESHGTATRRENQGIYPTVRRRDME